MPSAARRRLIGCERRALVLLSVCVVLSSAVAHAGWGEATAIPGYTGGFAISGPRIAIAGDESIAVVWEESGGNAWVSTRAGGSGPWTTFQIGLPFAVAPRIAMNEAGDLAAVWIGSSRTTVRYRPAGGAWEPTALLELGNPDIGARIAINAAGDVLVAWIGLDSGVTRYEVHTAFRPKAGPWPTTGVFQVPDGAANLWGELDVALDDAGNGVTVWTTDYASIDDGRRGGQFSVSVLRGAKRPPGSAWSTPTDLTPRGEEGSIPCSAELPVPFPDVSNPRLAIDPATGDLALAYTFDPTGIETMEIDGELACGPTNDNQGVTLAVGTTLGLPGAGSQYGTWVVGSSPVLAVGGGSVALAWNRCEPNGVLTCELRLQAGVAPLGSPLGVSVDELMNAGASGSPVPTAVGASSDGRGFLVHALGVTAFGWEMLAGITSDPPVTLKTGVYSIGGRAVAAAATATGYAVAAMAGSDRKLYIAEYAIFRDGFEGNDTGDWSDVVGP